jgi:actin-related protein
MIVDAIAASDADIRKDLYSNIILTGGNSLLPGTMFSLSLFLTRPRHLHSSRHSLTHAHISSLHRTHHITPLRTHTRLMMTPGVLAADQDSWIDCTRS